MNHHQRLLPPGENRALRYFSLLLFALMSAHETAAMPRLFKFKSEPSRTNPVGYLPAVGAPALRFQAPPPVVMPLPSKAALPSASTSQAASLEDQREITAPAVPEIAVASPSPAETIPAVEDGPEKTLPQKTKPTPQIIPDDTRPPVRPEDFLPFFQFPAPAGSPNGSLNVIVPVPRDAPSPPSLAPSSANYTQTPK